MEGASNRCPCMCSATLLANGSRDYNVAGSCMAKDGGMAWTFPCECHHGDSPKQCPGEVGIRATRMDRFALDHFANAARFLAACLGWCPRKSRVIQLRLIRSVNYMDISVIKRNRPTARVDLDFRDFISGFNSPQFFSGPNAIVTNGNFGPHLRRNGSEQSAAVYPVVDEVAV
jgi:hypothetical protein